MEASPEEEVDFTVDFLLSLFDLLRVLKDTSAFHLFTSELIRAFMGGVS